MIYSSEKLSYGGNVTEDLCTTIFFVSGTVAFSLYTIYFITSDADIPMKLTFSVYLCSAVFGMGASTIFHILASHLMFASFSTSVVHVQTNKNVVNFAESV